MRTWLSVCKIVALNEKFSVQASKVALIDRLKRLAFIRVHLCYLWFVTSGFEL